MRGRDVLQSADEGVTLEETGAHTETDKQLIYNAYLELLKDVDAKLLTLEYIVVHELAHLLEPTHNARFLALMDRFMPKWQYYRDELNRLPVRQETWSY